MELMISDKVVGSVYMNLKLKKEVLSETYSEILTKIKNKQYTFKLGKANVVINTYRKIYYVDNDIYVEGATLDII